MWQCTGWESTSNLMITSPTGTNDSVVYKIGEGQEVAIFRQTAANFRHKSLQVLIISMLPLNSTVNHDFQPQVLYFLTKTLW